MTSEQTLVEVSLDPDRVAAWLGTKNDWDPVGCAHRTMSCPLAQFVRETSEGAVIAWVGTDGWCQQPTFGRRGPRHRHRAWAQRFVAQTDIWGADHGHMIPAWAARILLRYATERSWDKRQLLQKELAAFR
jgi:hypothetical protein